MAVALVHPWRATTVTLVREPKEFQRYRAFVDAMHRHPSSSLDSLLDARERLVRSRPHAVVVERAAEPVAMIVGRIEESELDFNIGYTRVGGSKGRILRVLPGGYLGDLRGGEEAELACDGLLGTLAEGDADVVQLTGVPIDSPLFKAVQSRPSVLCRDHFVQNEPHWRLALSGDYQEFYRTRSKNTKGMIRQYKNRVDKEYGSEAVLRCFTGAGEVDRLMADMEAVATKTYQRGLRVGFMNTPEERDSWVDSAEKGWFRAYVLYLRGVPSAFWAGSLYRGVFTSDCTGFDPELSYYHPGTYLLLGMIEDLAGRGDVREFDFGSGDADYKRKFGTECWQESTVHVFAETPAGLRLGTLRNGTALITRSARSALATLGVDTRLKALWRKRLARASAAG